MPTEVINSWDVTSRGTAAQPWDTSYTYRTPGYANFAAATRGAGGPTLSAAGTVPYGNLASQTNALMTQQAQAPFVANLPNYESMVAQRSQNTGAQLKGEVPQDVVNQIIQGASERGILTGSPGSPNTNAAYLKALGLTSIGQQQAGSQNLSQSIADTPVPQLFSPASLFVPEHLSRMELGAAAAGMGAGRSTGGGGGGGGGYVGTPRIGSGVGWGGTPSWNQPQGAAVGRSGYFDDEGLLNSQSYSGGMWSGQGGNQYYNLPTGNTYGGGGWGDPSANIFQPAGYGFNEQYSGDDFLNELYSDFADVDFGSDYSPF